MLAAIVHWLKCRRDNRCAHGDHYWTTEADAAEGINLLTTRCTNCGAQYLTFG